MPSTPPPGPDLIKSVRAAFILRDQTLGRWCRENGLSLTHARMSLIGAWNGPKGRAFRLRILEAAGLPPPANHSTSNDLPIRRRRRSAA